MCNHRTMFLWASEITGWPGVGEFDLGRTYRVLRGYINHGNIVGVVGLNAIDRL